MRQPKSLENEFRLVAKWVCLHEDAQPSGPSASSEERSLRQTPDVAALTRSMSKGDEMAYRIFYDIYFDRLLRYLLVVTGGEEEAAREALQLALVRVTRHIKVFNAEEKFWSWLTVLARSALTDERRKRGRYFAFLRRFASYSELESAIEYEGEPDETLGALLKAKLASLSDDEKNLIEQKYTAHRSVREIAEEWRTTEKSVESKLSRIRRKLKDAVLAELKNEQPR